MKKKLLGFGLVTLLAVGLVACGNSSDESATGSSDEESKTIVVGASPTPHAEILAEAKPLLKEKGYDLQIKEFQDYILPNTALNEGELDANYFQHIPYLEKEIADKGYKFTNAGAVHLEKMALYSNDIKNVDDIPDGATIITSNSQSDWGRIITMLQDANLVKVKDGTDLVTATFDDIEENPKHLNIKHDIDPAILATAYQNKEGDLVAINANFAENIGLNPAKDGLIVEKDNSPYSNVIAVRTGDEDSPKIKALVEVLHSQKIKDFINEKWNGTVSPVE